MKQLFAIAKKYSWLIFTFIALGLTHAFLQGFVSRYFQTVIDYFSNNSLMLVQIIIYGTALISLNIVSYVEEYPRRKLEHGIELALKTQALKKMSIIDYLSYQKLGTGALIQRINAGAEAGSNILFVFYLRIIGELLPEMLFSIAFIYAINKTVMLTIMLGYVFVFVLSNVLLKALYRIKAGILINEEKFNHYLVRGFMEMVVFRVYRRFTREIKKAEDAAEEILHSKVKMKLIHEAFFTAFALLVTFVKIGIIIYGWAARALTIGQIVALIALVDNAYVPIAIFNVIYVQFKLDKIAYARYAEFMDAPDDKHLMSGYSLNDAKGDVVFSDVCYEYGGRNIFNGFNLKIQQSKTTALVGESGSGKSTAVKLIAGLLHPQSGSIYVGEHDLDYINLNSYYPRITYLPQEPPIFDGSLRENLVFDEKYEDAELLAALRAVGLLDLYKKLPGGLDTALGERGITLSGGERQQLALARLWFSQADLFIFDEATSAIDNITEEAVIKKVLDMLAGKTVISIAHRLDSIKSFDNIIVFSDGSIAEQGTFEQLMKRRKHFFELYNRSVK